jgi:thiol:disulfide interchange protein
MLALALVFLFAKAAVAAPPAPGDLVKATLIAETPAAAPGTTLWTALHLEIEPGWHVYWRNPGDAGLPTTIDWKLPPGFAAGPIEWPTPRRFVSGNSGNYGYADNVDLLVPIAVPQDAAIGQKAALTAEASWLVCAEICIPGGATLALDLPIAARTPAPDPETAARFAAARARLPVAAPFETRFAAVGGDWRLSVPQSALAGLDRPDAAFFPFEDGLIDNAAEARSERNAAGLDLFVKKAATAATPPATLNGLLVLHGAGGAKRAFAISANPAPAAASPSPSGIPWWQALLLAFLGGVVLNAMPCVFPILSLKLLSLAAHAHGRRGERLAHGLAYTAGVLASFALLGALLLAARAGGVAIGWGFQLQSPVFVALIAYLLFAMGLSLSGVAAFGAGLGAVGGGLASRSGAAGTFFTGVLATIVATPCTAPFMGTALGFALIAPALLALGIFLALGLGLAAPFLLAAILPGWRSVLPRPGPWMEFAKQILAFPLYATVAWLLWVLLRQIGPEAGLTALFGLVLVGFAVWIYGRTQLAAAPARALGRGLAAAAIVGVIALAASFSAADSRAARSEAEAGGLPYEPFTPARLAALIAAGKPVFVNLTASWCVTCLVNERVALDSDGVRKAFAARGVVPLKGDWTSRNPDITAFLQQFGRSGVPLYLYYDGKDAPVVLPQILTAATVLDAIGKS